MCCRIVADNRRQSPRQILGINMPALPSSKQSIYCPDCGYILDGLPASVCPKCGRTFSLGKPSRITKKGFLACFVIMIAISTYCGGYMWMRINQHFVRDGSYYTDPSGVIQSNRIRLGESQPSPIFVLAERVYIPIRWAESMYWRHLNPD